MSWRKHETKSFRKLITIQEWADYTGMSRISILNHLKKCKMENEYDSRDIHSTFNFLLYLLSTQIGLRNDDNRISRYTLLVSMFRGILKACKQARSSTK